MLPVDRAARVEARMETRSMEGSARAKLSPVRFCQSSRVCRFWREPVRTPRPADADVACTTTGGSRLWFTAAMVWPEVSEFERDL